MKKKLILRLFTAAKVLVIAVWLLATGALVAFKAGKLYDDVFAQLGLSKATATSSIKNSFLQGYLQYYGARNMKSIAQGDREAVTRDLLAYTKQYVQSEEFKKAYQDHRASNKPQEPKPAKTEQEIRANYIEETKKAVKNLEDGLKTMKDAEMKKALNESLEMFRKNLEEAEKNKSEMLNMIIEGEKSNAEYNKTQYVNDLAAWKEAYPESPDGYVKQRLREMLEATENVDFGAQLSERNGKKYFVNKAYEGKSNNWKMAFRAGKEVTTTARVFAQNWLKELK